MIEVQLPDGSVAEFPDGTPPEAMKSAIQKRFPPQAADAPLPFNPGSPEYAELPVPGTVAPVAEEKPFNETAFAQGTSGINEGIAMTLGAPVDLTNLALRAGAAGINALTGSDIQIPVDAFGGSATFKQAMAPAIRPESEDAGNQVIRRIGQEFGQNLIPGMNVATRSTRPIQSAVTQAAITLGSGAGAAAAEQMFPDNPYAELVGSILGGGAVGAGIAGAKKAVTPFEISPERRAMNEIMEREGIDLSAGQQTGSKGLQYVESELGGTAAANLTERQAEQFTQAALARIGVSAPRATPEVMSAAYQAIGQQFDDLAARNILLPDQQMGQDLGAVVRQYNSAVNPTARAPIIEDTLRDLVAGISMNQGRLSGEAYKSLRSRLGETMRSTANAELKGALQGIQQALDDAMERSIAQLNPADAGAWSQVRGDYRNFLAIENAMGKAGENTAMGLITPANLRSAVAQMGKRSYVQGQGDFADLARAGVATMSPLPQSGTAPRQFVRNAGMSLPTLMGAAFGGKSGDIVGAAVGGAAGAMVPGALGKLIMSGPGKSYLTNQAWSGPLNLAESAAVPTGGALLQLINSARPMALN